jgi:hypothetical protein
MCFVRISEQTAIISLYSVNWLVFITETKCLLSGTDWVFKSDTLIFVFIELTILSTFVGHLLCIFNGRVLFRVKTPLRALEVSAEQSSASCSVPSLILTGRYWHLLLCCAGVDFIYFCQPGPCFCGLLQGLWNFFFGAFAKLQKATIRHVGPSVRMGQLGYHWMGFHEIWYLTIFLKSVQKNQV